MMRHVYRFCWILLCLPCLAASCEKDPDPELEADLLRIEALTLNNELDKPFASTDRIRKEAFMLGLRYHISIPMPISRAQGGDVPLLSYPKGMVALRNQPSQTSVFCNARIGDADLPHDADIAPGYFDVTSHFRDAHTLPEGFDRALALTTVPAPGVYTFCIVIVTRPEGEQFTIVTQPVELY